MLVTRRSGPFIKQFSGAGDNRIICFKFWQAVIASGCPGECSYCFLQTQQPYRAGMYDLKGTLFENLKDIVLEAKHWLQQPTPAGLIIGENQDGLAFEQPYKKLLGTTPLELLIPLFEKENPIGHTLIVLSKFTSTSQAETFGPSQNVVFSWSLSLPTISRKYEKKVASLEARLSKAAELKAKGYRIRFRLDALAPIDNWQQELAEVISRVNDIEPEMLTVGALRASQPTSLRRAAEKSGRDASIFDYIVSVDPSGFKYRTEDEFHVEAFRQVRNLLATNIALGLCKEDISMWKTADIQWQGCHCLSGKHDPTTSERLYLLRRINATQRTSIRSISPLARIA